MRNIFTALLVLLYAHIFAQTNNKPTPINISTPEFQEFAPTLSGDGKTLIFQSNRKGGYKLFESTLQKDGKWSEPESIESINKIAYQYNIIGGPCLSVDGNTLYFCAVFTLGYGDMDIYVSKRNKKGDWTRPVNLGRPINTNNAECFPSISADGKKLFYTTTITNSDSSKCTKIMVSEQDANEKWQAPKEASAPVNASCDKSPRTIYDNKYLIYASNNKGNYDLYMSKTNEQGGWSEPIAMDYINSGENDLFPSLISSEELIYYTSKGDIYAAEVPNKFRIHGLSLYGKITDGETKKALNAKFIVIDSLSKDTIISNALSEYKLTVPAGKIYKVIARLEKYNDYTSSFSASMDEAFKELENNVILSPRKKEIKFKVTDSENNKGLKVKIKVTNLDTKEETIINSSAGRDGQYAINLREGNKYNVEISSIEGYAFSNTDIDVPYSDLQLQTTAVNIIDSSSNNSFSPIIDIKLQPLKDNTKLTLKDIYFKFNQVQLDEESYEELNRVVTLMKQNPSAQIEIAAHTDDVGSDDFNNKLSTKRAQEIERYIISKGIADSRLRPKGYGKTKPVSTETTEEARAKNRRVELKIIDIK